MNDNAEFALNFPNQIQTKPNQTKQQRQEVI